MIITNKVNMDLKRPSWMAAIDAVQDDRYCRNLELSLFSGGEVWTIPEDISAVIRYCKPDGVGGEYDTLPDGTTAWSAADNILTVALAPQVLTVPGIVSLSVILIRGNVRLSTFTVLINVHPAVNAQIAESEPYVQICGFLPAPESGRIGQYFRVASVDENGHVTAVEAVSVAPGASTAYMETYLEADGVGYQLNPAAAENDIWTQWDSRLAFGMDTENAPVPFQVSGQLLADGTIIAHNTGDKIKNRWGYHVFEAYAKNNYSRMTMLLDKHNSETGGKPSLEYYYYIGADHHAASYGNTKIGSDVKYHSFCFDRDKLTAYGEIDSKMPITLARISLANDIDTTYDTVAAADAAYEPESNPEANNKCLKYIALKNAENGAMFYDTDRDQLVCKVGGRWRDIPFTEITDAAYDIFQETSESGDSGETEEETSVVWENGVISADGSNSASGERIRTVGFLPDSATMIAANSGYEFAVCCYATDGSAPSNCYWNTGTGAISGSVKYYTSLNIGDIDFGSYPKLRLIARRTDLTTLSPSEGENILIS